MDILIIVGTIVTALLTGLLVYLAWKQLKVSQEQRKPFIPHALTSTSHGRKSDLTAQSSELLGGIVPIDFDDSKYKIWVSDEMGFIDIRGINIGTAPPKAAMRFPILDLYTELNVQKGMENWDLDQGNLISGQRIALTKILEGTRCIAIVGDPGSGKTTFLRYVARKQVQENVDPLPLYIDLPDLYHFATSKSYRTSKDTEQRSHPIKIEPNIIIQYLIEFSNKENLGFSAVGLLQRIDNGRFIFLFDSLDELPSAESRELLVDDLSKICRRWDKCKFVITSRPIALTGKAVPVGFEVVGIEPWQNGEIKTFLSRWSSQLFSIPHQQKSFYEELYSNILESQQLRSLARNPVMLTCMAVLHYNNRHLPAGRADLLEAVIQWLISSREALSRPSKETPEFITARYAELAHAMFELHSGRKNRVGRLWAANVISKHFANDEGQALQFLTREENQTGLLVRRGEGDISFWHSSFLEYLAAREIAGKTDEKKGGWWSKIRNHLYDPDWREVIALVPSCLNRLGSNRVDLFFDRISLTCVNADLETKIKTAGYAGRILRHLLMLGYDPGEVTSWNQLLDDISPLFQYSLNTITLEDRYEAAVAYGLSGDKRLGNFHDTWIKIPGKKFLMGAQSTDNNMHNFDEFANPWEGPVVEVRLQPFEIRKYPITVQEYNFFIEQGGYRKADLWSQEGWKWRVDNNINFPGNWDNQLFFPNCPVTSISWFEANAYCHWLSCLKPYMGFKYRLPSEAEWEYVARRGVSQGQRFPWGNNMTEGNAAECNWGGCNLRKKSPVGMFPASNTKDGISDMFGNVEEWCADSWTLEHTGYSPIGHPNQIEKEMPKVVRGGSTIRYMRLCRPTYRSKTYAYQRYQTIGFRLVRELLNNRANSD